MTDRRVAKWTGWIEGEIQRHVTVMYLHRMVWREASAIWTANPDLPDSYWWQFMRETYTTTVAMAVRRQADTKRGVASLGRLLVEINEDATLVALEPAIPAADAETLTESARSVKHYVDKHVAHAEASPPAVTLTFDDIDDAVDTIGQLFTKYALLLTGRHWATLEPGINHPWQVALTVPWMANPHGGDIASW